MNELRRIGLLYTAQNEILSDPLHLVLSGAKGDTTIVMHTKERNSTWRYLGDQMVGENAIHVRAEEPFDYSILTSTPSENIAHISLPEMMDYRDFPDLESFIELYLNSDHVRKAKALIVDVRGNKGGSRDLIQTFSKYTIPEVNSPWVGNMALVRSDQLLDEDISSMDGRYL